VREKRLQRKLRETAREIGIGAATLMRIESGRIPDVATFGKICRWLKIDPAEFLGYDRGKGRSPLPVITAHFKADRNPREETIRALAEMVLTVIRTQPGLSEPKDDK
jgi:transcriptional regulator with XRE-family HTH domain